MVVNGVGRTIDPDHFDRVVKLVVDSGDAPTFEDAAALLSAYELQILAGPAACVDVAWQAALLTAVNAGVRAVHGGVSVILADDAPCLVPIGYGAPLSEALRRYGAEVRSEPTTGVPTIAFDASVRDMQAPVVRPFAGQWVAGVSPDESIPMLTEASVTAAVLASTIAVSECFQRLRGYSLAADRHVGVSLWRPESAWDAPDAEGPVVRDLPSAAWLLGLGHLGQACAWLLALLPYPAGAVRPLVLQDDDRLSRANRATSMLAGQGQLGIRKTRLVSAAMEEVGWDARLVERRYHGGRLRAPEDPVLLIAGLDNTRARRVLDEAGFPVVLDAGLGAGPDGFLGMAIRRLPAARPSRELWPASPPPRPEAAGTGAAYRALEQETGDRCGVEELAGRTVATAFVGMTAAAWTIGGLLRELHGGRRYELIDCTLREPGTVVAIEADDQQLARVPTVRCGGKL